MEAKEFVKQYGWDNAKFYLSTASDDAVWISFDLVEHRINITLRVSDLKNLVDAHEFVSAHKSIEVAKKYCDLHDPYGTSNHYNNLRAKIELVGEL